MTWTSWRGLSARFHWRLTWRICSESGESASNRLRDSGKWREMGTLSEAVWPDIFTHSEERVGFEARHFRYRFDEVDRGRSAKKHTPAYVHSSNIEPKGARNNSVKITPQRGASLSKGTVKRVYGIDTSVCIQITCSVLYYGP